MNVKIKISIFIALVVALSFFVVEPVSATTERPIHVNISGRGREENYVELYIGGPSSYFDGRDVSDLPPNYDDYVVIDYLNTYYRCEGGSTASYGQKLRSLTMIFTLKVGSSSKSVSYPLFDGETGFDWEIIGHVVDDYVTWVEDGSDDIRVTITLEAIMDRYLGTWWGWVYLGTNEHTYTNYFNNL